MIQIADWAAKNPGSDIALMSGAPRNVKQELRVPLNQVLAMAKNLPEPTLIKKPQSASHRKWGGAEDKKLLLLKAERERMAKELKIQPSLLATNAILEILCSEAPQNKESLAKLDCLLPWQLEVAGDNLLKAMSLIPENQ